MKTIGLYFFNDKSFYILSTLILFSVLLSLGFFQLPQALAQEVEAAPAAAGQGSGGGGAGGGGQGSGGEGGGDDHGGGEGEEDVQGNNLSFPAIAADGYVITSIASSSFAVPYTGPYTGLSDEELAAVEGGTWYAQKIEGNKWQAAYAVATTGEAVSVFGVDWGDNIEAVNPVIKRPFRIEVGLYSKPEVSMLGYKMALLANPSSKNEVQGTDTTTYDSDFAVVVSEKPTLVIQDITDICTTDLEWSGSTWTLDGVSLPEDVVSFAPELNVGGKYVYGASQGGWRPDTEGMYRLTVSLPQSDISLAGAVVGNYSDWSSAAAATTEEEGEIRAATPVIDVLRNLTYADVVVNTSTVGGKPGDPGTDTYDPCAIVDDNPATTTDPVATSTDPVVNDDDEPSRSSGGTSTRRPLPEGVVAGVSTSQFVTQVEIDTLKKVLLSNVTLLNTEYTKLLKIMQTETDSATDLQKTIVLAQFKVVQNQYLRLLQFIVINQSQELLRKLQAQA